MTRRRRRTRAEVLSSLAQLKRANAEGVPLGATLRARARTLYARLGLTTVPAWCAKRAPAPARV